MRLLHWNCQGLGSPLTIPHLKDIRRQYNPDIMLLVETKNVNSLVQSLATELGYGNVKIVPACGSSGGAAIFWNNRVKISFLNDPILYHTNMCVEDGTKTFWLSYIYGNPVTKYRQKQWLNIIESESAEFLQGKPRLMIGDFNDIKGGEEKQGGIIRSVTSYSLFRRMLTALGMNDIKTVGGKYTWYGKRSTYTIMSKLDRAAANCDWLDLYPMSSVTLLPWIGSDHRPLLLNTEGNKWKKSNFFKYDSRWRLYPGLFETIKQVCAQESTNLSTGDMHHIIKQCRKALSQWRSKQPTNSGKLIQELKNKIQLASSNITGKPLNQVSSHL